MRLIPRVGLLGALASATGVGCTLLTSLDGLSGAPAVDAIDGSVDGGPSSEGGDGSPLEGGSDSSAMHPYIVLVGGYVDGDNTKVTPDVLVTRVEDDGSLSGWTASTPLPGPRFRGGMALLGDTLYYTGGFSSSRESTTFTAPVGAGAAVGPWSTSTALPETRWRHSAFAHAGFIYFAGGATSGTTSVDVGFASASGGGLLGNWQTTTSLPLSRASELTLANDSHVYVIGGLANDTTTGDAVVGDFGSNGAITAWRGVTDYPGTTSAAAGALTATHVFVNGGYTSLDYRTVEAAPLNPDGTLGNWFVAGQTLSGRSQHAMVIVRNRLYVIGGLGSANDNFASVEVADISGNGQLGMFHDATPLPAPRSFAQAIVFER